jgi:lipopolysaccharide transport system permease protein
MLKGEWLMVILAIGVGMILSASNVKYRDIKCTIPFGTQLWLFVILIIYPSSILPEKLSIADCA